jgi:excisionase family DNA binding protein
LTAQIIPKGDGSYVLKPNKPTEWLSVLQVAKECGVTRQTVCNWIKSGAVQARRVGPKLWQVDAASVHHGATITSNT